MYVKTGFRSGRNTVILKVLRAKNSASSGYDVWLDAIDVSGGSLSR